MLKPFPAKVWNRSRKGAIQILEAQQAPSCKVPAPSAQNGQFGQQLPQDQQVLDAAFQFATSVRFLGQTVNALLPISHTSVDRGVRQNTICDFAVGSLLWANFSQSAIQSCGIPTG